MAISAGLAWKARAKGLEGVDTPWGAGSGVEGDAGIAGLIA
jgi:hypothetical protein